MKAITKNTFREIKGSKSRFLSIFLICVIGVGFFSGVRATCNDMKTSADNYYDKQRLFDLRAVSTFGLTDGDKVAIKSALPDDCEVYASDYTDLAVRYNDKEYLTRVFSKLPEGINTPVITEGRDIQDSGECIISSNALHEGIAIGDKITLADLTEADEFPLTRTEYTVVGKYNSPMYVSMTQRGSTSIGDGSLDAFMIVSEEDFTQDFYTEIYVISETLQGMSSYSDEYENYRKTLSDKLEELGKERSAVRYDEVLGDVKQEIADGEKDLAQAKIDGQKELDDAAKQIENSQQALDEQKEQLAAMNTTLPPEMAAEMNAQLEAAQAEIDKAQEEYEDGVREFNEKIADAEKEIADAKQKVESAGNAEWYIFTRDDNVGYSEYGSNAERIDKIAAIFPVFFLLVAALVCLTTMSRMVEEQRTQIGTLKALGYGNGAVMRHYMVYAVSGAVVGGTLGAFGGCLLFPSVIMYAYSIMYTVNDFYYLFEPQNMFFSIGSMTLAIALTVYFSCHKALSETPSSLMRPKAPKAGKRVLIEKIPFLWNRMNFFAKVSGRNIFRYKRRMFMTVVGIAGCTALSLTGFGLKDSISDIVDLQYLDINKYSGFLAYKDDAKPSELEEIYSSITEYEPSTETTRALIKQYEVRFGEKYIQCNVTCVEDAENFTDFIDLRERVSGKKLSLSDGAVITEKAAKLLGVKKGDSITVQVSSGVYRNVEISGITEHYTSHYLYLSENQYEEIFGSSPKYNIIFFNNGISSEGEDAERFCELMLKNSKVLAVNINASSMTQIHNVLSIMDLVTVVLIVSAGALALVVLYNLTSVNITERIREIATLKVLGFYDLEVSAYVFRENIVLSLIGGAFGLGLGTALCMFVIETAEIDEVMFGRNIHPLSFLWAFLVTAAFSLLVNLLMSGPLKKISMVESLKSVE